MPRLSDDQWAEIRALWEAKKGSFRELAKVYPISHAAIQKRAGKEGWTQDLSEEVATHRRGLEIEEAAREYNPDAKTRSQVMVAAAMSQLEVIKRQKGQLGKAREIVDTLLDVLSKLLRGEMPVLMVPVMGRDGKPRGEKTVVPFLGDDEVQPVQAIGRLLTSLQRLINLEGKVYSLGYKDDPDDQAGDVDERAQEIMDRIRGALDGQA